MRLGIHLKEESFDHVLVSDSPAPRILGNDGLSNSVIYEERLRKESFWKYEGESRDQVMHVGFDELEIEPKGAFFRELLPL